MTGPAVDLAPSLAFWIETIRAIAVAGLLAGGGGLVLASMLGRSPALRLRIWESACIVLLGIVAVEVAGLPRFLSDVLRAPPQAREPAGDDSVEALARGETIASDDLGLDVVSGPTSSPSLATTGKEPSFESMAILVRARAAEESDEANREARGASVEADALLADETFDAAIESGNVGATDGEPASFPEENGSRPRALIGTPSGTAFDAFDPQVGTASRGEDELGAPRSLAPADPPSYTASAARSEKETPASIAVSRSWWPGIAWAVVFAILFAKTLAGHAVLAIWRRRLAPAGADLEARASDIARAIGLRKTVPIAVAPRVDAPLTFGLFRPVVVLPADFTVRFSRLQQDALFAHELGHVAGGHAFRRALSDLLTASLWWHPVSWWLRKRMHVDLEFAADEASTVLDDGPGALAEGLVIVASYHRRPCHLSGLLAASGVRFRSQLGRRVARLVRSRAGTRESGVARSAPRSLAFIGTCALATLGAAGSLWMRSASASDTPSGDSPMSFFSSAWKRSLLGTLFVAAGTTAAQDAPTAPTPEALPVPAGATVIFSGSATDEPSLAEPGRSAPPVLFQNTAEATDEGPVDPLADPTGLELPVPIATATRVLLLPGATPREDGGGELVLERSAGESDEPATLRVRRRAREILEEKIAESLANGAQPGGADVQPLLERLEKLDREIREAERKPKQRTIRRVEVIETAPGTRSARVLRSPARAGARATAPGGEDGPPRVESETGAGSSSPPAGAPGRAPIVGVYPDTGAPGPLVPPFPPSPGTPADASGETFSTYAVAGGASALDLVRLAEAFTGAIAERDLAEIRVSRTEPLVGNGRVPQAELDKVRIDLELARRRADVYRSMARSAREAQRAQLEYLSMLQQAETKRFEAGLAPPGSRAAIDARIATVRAHLEMLESILSSEGPRPSATLPRLAPTPEVPPALPEDTDRSDDRAPQLPGEGLPRARRSSDAIPPAKTPEATEPESAGGLFRSPLGVPRAENPFDERATEPSAGARSF